MTEIEPYRPTPEPVPEPLPEPLTPLAEAMSSLHEVYREARAAGFTDAQAMSIILHSFFPRPD